MSRGTRGSLACDRRMSEPPVRRADGALVATLMTSLGTARAPQRSRCGVLAAWRARSGTELDLAGSCLFAAAVAVEVWPDVAAAAGVEGEAGWAARSGV